jgi:hypothetical protein
MELISKRTRQLFRDYFSGYEVLRTIEDHFDAQGFQPVNIDPSTFPGARRSLVERYYAGIDWSSHKDVRRLLRVFETVLATLHDRIEDGDKTDLYLGNVKKDFRELTRSLQRDGYTFQDNRLVSASPVDTAIDWTSKLVEPGAVREHLRRIEDNVDRDPEQAIGSSKELLETIGKQILEHYSVDSADYEDTLPRLLKKAFQLLDLSSESLPETTRGVGAIKKVFSGLSQIVAGTAELRNLYGTGHGRARRSGAQPRHARVVVGSAATLATFLLETLNDRRNRTKASASPSRTPSPS